MKRISIIGTGIVGSLVGLGFVFPAIAQLREHGVLPTMGVFLLMGGIALVLGSVTGAAMVIRKTR